MLCEEDSSINLLLESGCDRVLPDQHGNTPLHQACMLDSVSAVRFIVKTMKKVDLNQENAFGETPMMLACKSDNSASLRVLLKHGAGPRHQSTNGLTAFDCAMYHGSHSCVLVLLRNNAVITPLCLIALQQGLTDALVDGHRMIETYLQHKFGPIPQYANQTISPDQLKLLAMKTDRAQLVVKKEAMRTTLPASNPQRKDKSNALTDPFILSQETIALIAAATSHPGKSKVPSKAVAAAVGAGEVIVGTVGANLITAAIGL